MMSQTYNPVEKLWPDTFRPFVRKNPDRPMQVIILFKDGQLLQAGEQIASHATFNDFGVPGASILNIVNGVAATAACSKILTIAASSAIEAIWYIHPKVYRTYVGIIKALEKIVAQSVAVANISLAPGSELLPWPYRPNEPIHLATKVAADNNQLIVFSAGNGGPSNDSLNPWSLAPWVMCVGATSQDGKTLAQFSARGRPGDLVYRPTVVAPGMDIEMTFSPEDVPTLKQEIKYQANGTSFAAPTVCRIAQQIMFFLDELKTDIAKGRKSQDDDHFTFLQIYNYNQGKITDERITSGRLIGSLDVSSGMRVATYPVNPSPYVVKQIIMDMALEVPGYQPHEVGAGFVNLSLAQQSFGRFGKVEDIEVDQYDISN